MNADYLEIVEAIVPANEPRGNVVDISSIPGNMGGAKVADATLFFPYDLVLVCRQLLPGWERLQKLHQGTIVEGGQRVALINKLALGLPMEGGGASLADEGLWSALADDRVPSFPENPQSPGSPRAVQVDPGAMALAVQLKPGP